MNKRYERIDWLSNFKKQMGYSTPTKAEYAMAVELRKTGHTPSLAAVKVIDRRNEANRIEHDMSYEGSSDLQRDLED